MRLQQLLTATLFLLLLGGPVVAGANTPVDTNYTAPDRTLTIGTKVTPPFVIKNADGSYSGISIELWKAIAKQLGIKYKFKETDLQDLITGLRDGSLDASVAALTATEPREEVIDFTHPFYTTGLAIAVSDHGNRILSTLSRFFSWPFFVAVGGLIILLLIAGFILWLFERRANGEQFGGSPAHGIGAGLWWAAVTMTTVGYGDKAPETLGGRIIGLIWMFTGVIVISSFTASIATSLTVGQLHTGIKGPQDLASERVATQVHSSSAEYLGSHGIHALEADSLSAALADLAAHKVDAVVYDAPILKYHVNTEFPGQLKVLPNTFERQDYAIALPTNSKLREPINLLVLNMIGSGQWNRIKQRYLGRQN